MTLRTPPSWLQNGSHPAENDRLTTQALYATTGIIGSGSLAVTQNSPVGMSVRVASGWASIVGTTQSNMGTYVIYNDATDTLTITAADPTNPRIDRVVATVNDAYYTGSTNNVVFQVVAGTPAGSPVAPATPANSISLATVAVAAAATQIVTADITDTRVATTTNLAIGDLTEIQAGTGISVTNGTGPIPTVAISSAVVTLTGSQTLTNKTLTAPVISTISNTGTITLPTATDTLVGRATSDTLTNKTINYANNTITNLPAPFSQTLLSTTTLSGASTTISSINQTYKDLLVYVYGVNLSTAADIYMKCVGTLSGFSGFAQIVNYWNAGGAVTGAAGESVGSSVGFKLTLPQTSSTSTANRFKIYIANYASGFSYPFFKYEGTYEGSSTSAAFILNGNSMPDESSYLNVQSLTFATSTGTFSGGTVKIYGVN